MTSEYGHDYCRLKFERRDGVGVQGTPYDFGSEDLLSDLDDLESLGAIAMVNDAADWILGGRKLWLSNVQFRKGACGKS